MNDAAVLDIEDLRNRPQLTVPADKFIFSFAISHQVLTKYSCTKY